MNLELGTRIWVTMIPLGRGRMAWRGVTGRGVANRTLQYVIDQLSPYPEASSMISISVHQAKNDEK